MPVEFLTSLCLRFKALFMKRRLDRDLEDELRFHLAMRREKLEKAGLPSPEASASARRRFGNPVMLREATRSQWKFTWIEGLVRDLRYACRTLAKAPAFTAIAIITLAFGIGANTAIFSIVNGVLLRAMPYERPQDIYSIREIVQTPSQRNVMRAVNGGNVLEWRKSARSFQEIALMMPSNDNLGVGDESAQVHGLRVSSTLFPLLGLHPRIGRAFLPEEDVMGRGIQIILTDALWRGRFGAKPEIVGQKVLLNGFSATVIGVLPPSFYFPKQAELASATVAGWDFSAEYFTNANLGPWERRPSIGNFNFAAIGRLRPGVAGQQGVAELESIEAAITEQHPVAGVSLHAELIPLKTAVAGPAAQRIWMLMGGAALVLAIVCVNLAGLTIGRNTTRTKEIAIRLALGAGRATLVRQLTVEGLVLAATGGTLGVAAAYAGVRALVRYAPPGLPRVESVTMDGWVLMFSAGVALAAGILFSLLPSLQLEGRNPDRTLRSAAASASPSRRSAFLRNLLAGSEIALCTVLLICALLLGQSLARVLRDNAWLNEERVVAIDLSPSPKQYQKSGTRTDFYRRLVQETRALPGVASAGLVSAMPLRGPKWGDSVDVAEMPQPDARQPVANFRFLSPGYDDAIGLSLIAGRPLRDSDWGRQTVLISEGVARQFPGHNLVGMHLKWTNPDSGKPLSLEVIGVFRDVRTDAEEASALTVYIPTWFWPPWDPSLVVRSKADPGGVTAAVRRTVHSIDSQVPVTHIETLRQMLDGAVESRRFLTRLGVVFAASATFLAALGLYGVLSLAAGQRRREIAIRMAIGASHPAVFRMVVVQAVGLTACSVAAGVLLATGVERSIVRLLYGVSPADLGIHVIACAIVVAVGLGASILPALRAARVDPLAVLKYE
jgi:putative ABC transport system permease protein